VFGRVREGVEVRGKVKQAWRERERRGGRGRGVGRTGNEGGKDVHDMVLRPLLLLVLLILLF